MTIKAILQGRDTAVHQVSPGQSVKSALQMLAERRIGAMPVISEDGVAGIFSERDIIYGLSAHGPGFLDRKVGEVMTSPAITVDPETAVLDALSLMTRRRIRHLPVISGGQLVGFVSIGDLVKYRVEKIEAEANAMRDYIQAA
jgi:CBS domain-containing protein